MAGAPAAVWRLGGSCCRQTLRQTGYAWSVAAAGRRFDATERVQPRVHRTHTVDALATSPAVFPPLDRLVSMYALVSGDPEGTAALSKTPTFDDVADVANLFKLHKGTAAAAFVDNNTSHAAPRLLQMIREADDLGPDDVKFIIVTHVHLDHAAGTGTLLALCPNATVLCHPRAKRHLVDPSALLDSARRVYSPEEFQRQAGNMIPCPESRIHVVQDGETIDLVAGRPLTFYYTEGHARHHIAVHDAATDSVFTGDTFGACYPDGCQFQLRPDTLFPTSSPVDFDVDEAVKSVELISALPGVARLFPTHFGVMENLGDARCQMLELLPKLESMRAAIESALAVGQDRAAVITAAEEAMRRLLRQHLTSRGIRDAPDYFWQLRELNDVAVNALGLVVAAERAGKAQANCGSTPKPPPSGQATPPGDLQKQTHLAAIVSLADGLTKAGLNGEFAAVVRAKGFTALALLRLPESRRVQEVEEGLGRNATTKEWVVFNGVLRQLTERAKL